MQIAKKLLMVFAVLHQIAPGVVDAFDGPLKNISPEGPCNPGELVFVGFCNLCLCNSQGIPNQLCAKSWCRVQTPLPPRSSSLLDSNTLKPEAYTSTGNFRMPNPSKSLLNIIILIMILNNN